MNDCFCECGRALGRLPNLRREPCPDCQPEEYTKLWDEYESEVRQHKVEKLIAGSGFAPRYRTLTLDGFEIVSGHEKQMKAVLDICREYAENFKEMLKQGRWLIMIGPCGTGKGHLSAAIGNYVLENNLGSVLYRKYIELVSKIKETWGGHSDTTENQIIEAVRDCDLLILDEIGLQFETNAEKVILYRILDNRYENVKPVIMTTNLSEKQLERVIGERALDRIYEPPNEILILNWPSYRRRAV